MRWLYDLWDNFQEWRWQRRKRKWADEWRAISQTWNSGSEWDDMFDYWEERDGWEGTDE